MGLAICVGIPSEVRESDPEYVEYFGRQMEVVSDVLASFGLPEHAEPLDIDDGRTVEFDVLGYAGLHYLRRLAAHMALRGELPPPGEGDAASDPVLNDYYRIFDASYARGEAAGMPFQHLIVHGDAEGYYLPVEFEEVISPDASLEIAGGTLGSAHALLRECRELARQLELPEGLTPDDEAFDAPFDDQGLGDAKWEQYRVESYVCLGLIGACETSVETGAAVVFA